MKNNNGKMILAIVAMFVVAVSVIGFTYAYFVASVTGNTNTSVNVTAGIIEIDYQTGQHVKAVNIVPGWENNDDYYYDPVASVFTLADNTKGIRAVSAKACTKGSPFPGEPAGLLESNCQAGAATAANGKVGRSTFTVAHTQRSTSKAYYIIKLVDINNGVTDDTNFKVQINMTKGDQSNKLLGEVSLKKSGEQLFVTAPIELETGDDHAFEVVMKYNNVNAPQSTGATVTAKVEIMGVAQQLGADGQPNGKWVDANNVELTF